MRALNVEPGTLSLKLQGKSSVKHFDAFKQGMYSFSLTKDKLFP